MLEFNYLMMERRLEQRLPIYSVLHDETVIKKSDASTMDISPIIEGPNSPRFNKIALFSFSVDLGWSTWVEARIQNLPQSALGKLPKFTKIQDGRHCLIQNH